MAIEVPKAQKAFVYACAIVGALGAFLGLGSLFGGGMGMPRFEAAVVGGAELAWFIPLAAAGVACGWAFRASDKASAAASRAMGDRPVIKALLAGLLLSICGTVLPFSLFAGESQTQMVMDSYAALTPACIHFGWRGGHFFPVIFSGVCLGYGFSLIAGVDAVFCAAVCIASLMGAVMRQPVMVVLLLFMCFPPSGVVCMLAAAAIGSAIPLPRALR